MEPGRAMTWRRRRRRAGAMKTLVLGGSVFVGKHTVEALLAGGPRRRRPQPRQDADRAARRCRAAGGGPDRHRADAPRPRRPRLGCRVRRLGVRDGRRGLGHRGPARRCSTATSATTSTSARSWPTTSRSAGSSRGPRTCRPTPTGPSTLRRLQGGRRGGDAGPPRGQRVPGDDRAPGRDLRPGQQHLRHGAADVPAPARPSADRRAPRRPGRRLLRARRRPVRGDGRRWSGQPAAVGEVFNISGRDGVRQPLHRGAVRCRRRGAGRRVPARRDARRRAQGRSSATCSACATTPWRASRRRSGCSGSRAATTCASGHEHTYEWFRAKGYADVEGPMVDPMWRASWDFDAEAAVAKQVRGE